jgi:hypothetical protein
LAFQAEGSGSDADMREDFSTWWAAPSGRKIYVRQLKRPLRISSLVERNRLAFSALQRLPSADIEVLGQHGFEDVEPTIVSYRHSKTTFCRGL